jgi:hypothetical protein
MPIEYVILGTLAVSWVVSPASEHVVLGTLVVSLSTFASIGTCGFGYSGGIFGYFRSFGSIGACVILGRFPRWR